MSTLTQPRRSVASPLAVIVFLLVAVVGLYLVKWSPYYHRAHVAELTHSIGTSILTGKSGVIEAPSWQAALHYALVYGRAIWEALVVALLLGSAVQALLPTQWVTRALGRAGLRSVAVGGLIALPGMMCTCCAAPIVVGLRESHASRGAAVAFWLGNSVLNPATLVFMGFVLGWHWSALRLALGIVLVFGGGWLVDRTATAAERAAAASQLEVLAASAPTTENLFVRWMKVLVRMAVRLIPEYLVLVLLLGAARALLFSHAGPEVGNTVGWILAFAVAGMLFVIPTAGEVPIVQAMLALGVQTGPAAALLMTLAPISLPSLAMTARALGARTVATVMVAVVAIGVAGGFVAAALF